MDQESAGDSRRYTSGQLHGAGAFDNEVDGGGEEDGGADGGEGGEEGGGEGVGEGFEVAGFEEVAGGGEAEVVGVGAEEDGEGGGDGGEEGEGVGGGEEGLAEVELAGAGEEEVEGEGEAEGSSSFALRATEDRGRGVVGAVRIGGVVGGGVGLVSQVLRICWRRGVGTVRRSG